MVGLDCALGKYLDGVGVLVSIRLLRDREESTSICFIDCKLSVNKKPLSFLERFYLTIAT
jgi:hypothetical protein